MANASDSPHVGTQSPHTHRAHHTAVTLLHRVGRHPAAAAGGAPGGPEAAAGNDPWPLLALPTAKGRGDGRRLSLRGCERRRVNDRTDGYPPRRWPPGACPSSPSPRRGASSVAAAAPTRTFRGRHRSPPSPPPDDLECRLLPVAPRVRPRHGRLGGGGSGGGAMGVALARAVGSGRAVGARVEGSAFDGFPPVALR